MRIMGRFDFVSNLAFFAGFPYALPSYARYFHEGIFVEKDIAEISDYESSGMDKAALLGSGVTIAELCIYLQNPEAIAIPFVTNLLSLAYEMGRIYDKMESGRSARKLEHALWSTVDDILRESRF